MKDIYSGATIERVLVSRDDSEDDVNQSFVQLQDVVRGEDSGDEDDLTPVDDERSLDTRMTHDQVQPPQPESGGQKQPGMSRSVSDTTLRKHALHLNLNQSVLPSFTPLHQFKVVLLTSSTGCTRKNTL